MAALMKSANISATVESMVANLMASRLPSGVARNCASGRWRNAGRDCAASPSRRGCRCRRRAFRIGQNSGRGNKAEQHAARSSASTKTVPTAKQTPMVAMSVMTSASISGTLLLQIKDGQHVGARDDATPDQRNAEEQLQRDGRADHLGQIARGDGDFAENPQKPDGRAE